MIVELMRLSCPSEELELGDALASLVGPIQVQHGCLDCRLWQLRSNPYGLQIEARWASQSDLICHLQSDIYKTILGLMEMSTSQPVVEFLSVGESRGLDLVEAARNQSV